MLKIFNRITATGVGGNQNLLFSIFPILFWILPVKIYEVDYDGIFRTAFFSLYDDVGTGI